MALFQIAAIGSNFGIPDKGQSQIQLYNAVRDCLDSSMRAEVLGTRLSSDTDFPSCLDRRITIEIRRTQITSRPCSFSAAG